MTILNECHILALNGRTTGDLHGMFTYHGPMGSSTIDLGIISPALMKKIRYFKVCNPVAYSDHCPIAINLKVRIVKPAHNGKLVAYSKFICTTEGDELLRQTLNSNEFQKRIELFGQKQYNNSTLACEALTDIIYMPQLSNHIGYTPLNKGKKKERKRA